MNCLYEEQEPVYRAFVTLNKTDEQEMRGLLKILEHPALDKDMKIDFAAMWLKGKLSDRTRST